MKKTIRKIKIALLAMVCVFTMLGMTMEVQAGSADNSLQYIKVTEGSLSPTFDRSRLNYTVHVGTDTSSIDVSAKTSNSNAKILSGVGTYTLSENETKARILVEAENGTQVTYTVTIIKDGASQPSDTDEPADTDEPSDTPEEPADTPDDTTDEPDTGVEGYTITDLPETAEIPIGFSETTANYQDKEYTAYKFDNGDIILFYMANEAGEGGFFVYNLELGHMYPFVRVDAGEHKLILMEASAYGSAYPGEPATLTIGSQVFEAAYQREPGDEYQFYAMNEDGVEGWYQYNVAEDTFSTFSMSYEVEEPEDEEADTEYLQKAYNDLNDKFNARKDRDIKIIAGLIVVIVILIFVIINLLLRGGRESADDEDEDDIFEEETSHKKSGGRLGRKVDDDDFWTIPEEKTTEDTIDLTGITEMADTDTVTDAVLAVVDVKEDAAAAEDSEDAEDFSDFDEDYSDYKREKKEKKKEKRRKMDDIFDDDDENDLFSSQKMFVDKMDSDDDDIEVMDLNDL